MDMMLNIFVSLWNIWCVPFNLVPYGDPYVAGVALFALGFHIAWRMTFGPSRTL